MVNENLILSLAGIYYMTIFKVLHKFKSLQGRGGHYIDGGLSIMVDF